MKLTARELAPPVVRVPVSPDGAASLEETLARGGRDDAPALRHLNEILEGELKRIAHVLHDEAGQLLASVHLALVDIASEFTQMIVAQRGYQASAKSITVSDELLVDTLNLKR